MASIPKEARAPDLELRNGDQEYKEFIASLKRQAMKS